MESKQTAVEWLKEMLIDNKYLSKDAEHLFEEALAIEAGQVQSAYLIGQSSADLLEKLKINFRQCK